jgi:hypothetical protein
MIFKSNSRYLIQMMIKNCLNRCHIYISQMKRNNLKTVIFSIHINVNKYFTTLEFINVILHRFKKIIFHILLKINYLKNIIFFQKKSEKNLINHKILL